MRASAEPVAALEDILVVVRVASAESREPLPVACPSLRHSEADPSSMARRTAGPAQGRPAGR